MAIYQLVCGYVPGVYVCMYAYVLLFEYSLIALDTHDTRRQIDRTQKILFAFPICICFDFFIPCVILNILKIEANDFNG